MPVNIFALLAFKLLKFVMYPPYQRTFDYIIIQIAKPAVAFFANVIFKYRHVKRVFWALTFLESHAL